MADFVVCTLDGAKLTTEKGTLVSDILSPAQSADHVCGGKGSCKKCRVKVFGELSVPTDAEKSCFSAEELRSGLRLACQTKVLGDCRIETEDFKVAQICTEGTLPDFTWTPIFEHFGAAVDIGTTTLVVSLYNKEKSLATASASNPQGMFGADVMSRVQASLEGKKTELALLIRQAISELLTECAMAAGISLREIDRISIAGNTAMLYLLTERDVTCLSRAPFVADHLFGEWTSSDSLCLPCPNAKVYLAPCISAFVGGDTTMALLASGICEQEETALLCDIGTNGEMALWHQGKLSCCSTAAGPAFEGAGLSCGMRGETGAVDRVWIENGQLGFHTIGETIPRGICGGGAVDAVACLLQLEELDETGYLGDDPYYLTKDVFLTAGDIRNIQLAKAGIFAGIKTLVTINDIGTDMLVHLYIAGGFGLYLNLANAAFIGLLPNVAKEKVRLLGNSALMGAAMILLDSGAEEKAEAILKRAKTIELASNAFFQDTYIKSMFFAE